MQLPEVIRAKWCLPGWNSAHSVIDIGDCVYYDRPSRWHWHCGCGERGVMQFMVVFELRGQISGDKR